MNLQKLFGTSLENIWKAIVTFWYPILCGCILAGLWIYIIQVVNYPYKETEQLLPWIMAAYLGLPLGFALHQLKKIVSPWITYPALSCILVGIGYWLSQTSLTLLPIYGTLLFLISHLLAAVSEYIHNKEEQAFWQFNINLLIEFINATFFSAVLFIGLAIALAAVQFLLGIQLDSKLYFSVWVVVAFVVQPILFFTGYLNSQEEAFPKILKNLIQYVLLPLVALYILILYAFGVKILVGNTPKGYVAWLVLSLSVVGIMVLLLSYPLRKAKEEFFIGILDKYYFWVMIPLLVILAWAINVRVGDYGLTENRVALIYLNVWLGFITIYMLTGRRMGLVIVPLSLVVFSAFALVGPLSLVDLSVHDQAKALVEVLEKNKSHWVTTKNIPDSTQLKIVLSLEYLSKRTALPLLNQVRPSNLPAFKVENDSVLYAQLGLTYYSENNRKYQEPSDERVTIMLKTDLSLKPLQPAVQIEMGISLNSGTTTYTIEHITFQLLNNKILHIEDTSETYLDLDLTHFLEDQRKMDSSGYVLYPKMVIPLSKNKGEVVLSNLTGVMVTGKVVRIESVGFSYLGYGQYKTTNTVPK